MCSLYTPDGLKLSLFSTGGIQDRSYPKRFISLVGETEYFPRKVREAIHIRRQRPEMNRDGGLELPHIYDRVLIAATPSGRDANSQSEEVH